MKKEEEEKTKEIKVRFMSLERNRLTCMKSLRQCNADKAYRVRNIKSLKM